MSMSPLKLVLPQNLSGDREEQRINSGINHVAGLPQQVDEVYSKKVFIGGLPPDIDESIEVLNKVLTKNAAQICKSFKLT